MAQKPPPAPPRQQQQAPQAPKPPDMLAPLRTRRFWITLAVLFVLNIVISNLITSAGQAPTVTISYNTFLDQVDAGNVVSVTSTADAITGVTKKPVKSQTTSTT